MAYDAFGNYTGPDIEAVDPFAYETEEERRKRLAAQAKAKANEVVTKQEVVNYADGSQTRTVKEEVPAAGPVSPETFARMQQAESGNRDYTASGAPVTSPKGAMFANQVMPATAAQPGFGVRPAADQSPEEYNRVGREYFDALLKHFGGDEQKAVAAYNAGPGTVQRNVAANQGQLNPAQLPRETQGYLDKVLGGAGKVLGAVIPSAQAGTLTEAQRRGAPTVTPGAAPAPIAPVAPTAQVAQPAMQIDDNGNRLITNADGTTTILGPDNRPLAAGGMETRDTPQFRNRLFEEAGKDPFKWMEIAKNPEYAQFPGMQTVAKEQTRALLEQDFKMGQAKEQATQAIAAAASGDPKASRAIADELKNQDGSWVKMILLGFLSPQLAGEEAVKLGFGNKWQSVTNEKGETALIQVNAKGLPLKGISADNKELSQEQLAGFATGGKRELDTVGGTYINDKTGEVGRVVTDKRTGQSYVQTDTGRKPMTGFRPQSSTGGLSDMRARQIQELNIKLQGKTLEEKMAILRPYNQALVGAGQQAIDPSEVGIAAPQIGSGPAPMAPSAPAAAPVGPAVPGTPAVTGAMPVPRGGAPVTAPVAPGAPVAGAKRPTLADIEASKAGQKEIATETAKTVAASADTQNLINSIDNKVIPLLDSGEHNVGSALSGAVGRGPIAQAIGSQFETTDAKNTKTILDTVNKLAAEGLKTLGSNPSTADLQFWTQNKPNGSSDPAFMKEWIESRSADLKRKLGYAEKQTEAGGGAGNAPAVETAPLSPAEKAKAELERRRKEKK